MEGHRTDFWEAKASLFFFVPKTTTKGTSMSNKFRYALVQEDKVLYEGIIDAPNMDSAESIMVDLIGEEELLSISMTAEVQFSIVEVE